MSDEMRIERGGAKKSQKCGGDVYIPEVEGTQKVQQRVARLLNGCVGPGGGGLAHYSRSGHCPGTLLGECIYGDGVHASESWAMKRSSSRGAPAPRTAVKPPHVSTAADTQRDRVGKCHRRRLHTEVKSCC